MLVGLTLHILPRTQRHCTIGRQFTEYRMCLILSNSSLPSVQEFLSSQCGPDSDNNVLSNDSYGI